MWFRVQSTGSDRLPGCNVMVRIDEASPSGSYLKLMAILFIEQELFLGSRSRMLMA